MMRVEKCSVCDLPRACVILEVKDRTLPDLRLCKECVGDASIKFDDAEQCKGCDEPATTADSVGVPLCQGCYDECLEGDEVEPPSTPESGSGTP